MKKIIFLLYILWISASIKILAQKIYTDYKPTYKQWDVNYILDKIEYTKTRTIFYFRYLSSSNGFGDAISFFGANHPDHWCLENIDNPSEVHHMIEIRNLARSGRMMYPVLPNNQIAEFTTDGSKSETFICEVHFPRLPKTMTRANFLEGYAAKRLTNHFHCLNVKIKTFDDPENGNKQDMYNRIAKFEDKINAKNSPPSLLDLLFPKPKPRDPVVINPKPKPKPKDPVVINPRPKPKPKDPVVVKPKPKDPVVVKPKPDVSGAQAQEGEIDERK